MNVVDREYRDSYDSQRLVHCCFAPIASPVVPLRFTASTCVIVLEHFFKEFVAASTDVADHRHHLSDGYR